MPMSKSDMIARLNQLSSQLIVDRTREDIDALLELYKLSVLDMSSEQKAFLNNPQKGAYNYTDRNRVSEFCNVFVELMQTYYGVNTEGYVVLPTLWGAITDPTKEELEQYINSILIVRDKWYAFLFGMILEADTDPAVSLGGKLTEVSSPDYTLSNVYGSEVISEEPPENILVFRDVTRLRIDHIYDGITLETANNIEKVLDVIYEEVTNHMLNIEPVYCGQLYGFDSTSVVSCGMNFYQGVKSTI